MVQLSRSARRPRAGRKGARLFATLAVSVGAMSSSAYAGGEKVLVLPYQHLNKGMPGDLGEQTTIVVTREMSQQGLTVVQGEDLQSEAAPKSSANRGPRGDPEAQGKAEGMLATAREAMDDADFERSASILKRASRLLEDNGDAVPDLRLLAEIYLQLGVSYFRDGLEDEGDDMLNKAIHYDPERKLDAADYPPIFVRVFERARYNVLRRPRGRVEVRARAGSQVLLDGRNLGQAPIILTDALPGRHWVRVERAGEPAQIKRVRIRGKKTVLVEFEGGKGAEQAASATGVQGAIAANSIDASHIKLLTRAGKKAGAKIVMIGGIYKTDTAYKIRSAYVKVSDGSVGRLTDIAFDLDMLSAEIEVFKLVESAKKEASAASYTKPIPDRPFKVAPDYKPRRSRRIARAGKNETRLSQARAAPAPLKAPTEIYAGNEAPPPPPPKKLAKGPPTGPKVLPKDEMSDGKQKKNSRLVAVAQPGDGQEEEGSSWWIWVLASVAVAGAAAGGVVAATQLGGNDNAQLSVGW